MADTWFSAKEWKARLVEFAGRRSLRNVANGETATYDVSRSEGQVSQEGDAFNTKNMNDLEQRISNGFANAKTNIDALNRDLGGLSFGQDADGNWGYKIGGADTVTPFKSGITLVGSYPYTTKKGYPNNATHVFTVNATKISGYKKMTEKNFIVETLRAFSGNSGPYNPQVQWTEVSVSKSYDSNNGILTVTATFREPRNGIAETRYEANVYC